MQEDQTELLMKQTRKMAAVKAVWRQDYDKEFLRKIENFIMKNTKKLSGHFNIVPSDIDQEVSVDLMCYADFIKPTCKVELFTVFSKKKDKQQELRQIHSHAFVPQANVRALRIKCY